MKVNWQQKLFFYWFPLFFASFLLSMFVQERWAISITVLLLAFIGVVMCATTAYDAFYSLASRRWPRAEFAVSNAWVSRSARMPQNFNAYLELEYEVGGKRYELLCHDYNIPVHRSVEQARDYIEQVKDGKHGSVVRYNPERPEQAYARGRVKVQHVLAIAVGLALVVFPVLYMAGVLHK